MDGSFELDSLLRHPTISSALSFPHEPNSSSDSGSSYSYSKPILLLDLIWNLDFVLVSVVVLFSSFRERPSTPLRLWASVYALQCLLHVVLLCLHHYTRGRIQDHHYVSSSAAAADDHRMASQSIMKRLESMNTIMSTVWWIIGFYWIVSGGQVLLQDSPRLYWLTVIFLAFDVFFIIFCIGMAFIVFLVVFGCLPILAIAYSVAIRKGASEDDIRSLPKYKYYEDNSSTTLANDKKQEGHLTTELALLPEDSECCICLTRYVDGVELCSLPCNHHFHSGCITKWLRINATCPLCKFNIRSPDTLVQHFCLIR